MKWLLVALVGLPFACSAQSGDRIIGNTERVIYTGPQCCNTATPATYNPPPDPNYPANGPAVSPGPTMFRTGDLCTQYQVEVSRSQNKWDQSQEDARLMSLSNQLSYRPQGYNIGTSPMLFQDIYDLSYMSASYRNSILKNHNWRLIATRDTGTFTIETYSYRHKKKHNSPGINNLSIVYENLLHQDGSATTEIVAVSYYGTDYSVFKSANIFALGNNYKSDVDSVTLDHPYLDFYKDNATLRLRYTKTADKGEARYTVVFCREQ